MPHKVLIIEDDLDCRDLIVEVLTLEGHEAVAAGTAAEAVAALRSQEFTVVFSDLRVPGGDPDGGIIGVIREAGFLGRIVLISGDDRAREIARRRGVECQPKPISIDGLLAALAK